MDYETNHIPFTISRNSEFHRTEDSRYVLLQRHQKNDAELPRGSRAKFQPEIGISKLHELQLPLRSSLRIQVAVLYG